MGIPLRVLIVEDSEADATLLLRELRRGGYDPVHQRVYTAKAMEEALGRQEWDIVIADYTMPRFTGLEALKLLQSFDPDLPFILVSGTIGEEIAVEAMKAGAQDYVMKGKLARLLPAVERELGDAEVRREHRKAEQALRESEARYRALVETSPDPVFLLDLEGTVLLHNPQAGALFADEDPRGAVGRSALEFLLPEEVALAAEALQRVREEGAVRNVQLTLLGREGARTHLEVNASLLKAATGKPVGAITVVRDVTERWKAEQRAAHLSRLYRVLSEANEAIFRLRDQSELYQAICRIAVELGGYRTAWLALVEASTGELHPAAQWGSPCAFPEAFGREIREAVGGCPNQCRVLPLWSGTKPLGAFGVCRQEGRSFEADETGLLEELADSVSFAIGAMEKERQRQQAEEELARSVERLRKAMEGMIQAMATTTEVRDPYTAGHQRRVAQLAGAIGREMGLPEDMISAIHMAAAIHDLGKIAVPAEILTKPSRLSTAEFAIIQEHSRVAYDILSPLDFPWPVAEIVVQHHERLDGSGYPNGLSNGQIRLEAQIIAVADVVEAMASHRPYRPALGVGAALQEISQQKGRHYLYEVVDACLNLFREKGFALR